jgi:hypothetical protein
MEEDFTITTSSALRHIAITARPIPHGWHPATLSPGWSPGWRFYMFDLSLIDEISGTLSP